MIRGSCVVPQFCHWSILLYNSLLTTKRLDDLIDSLLVCLQPTSILRTETTLGQDLVDVILVDILNNKPVVPEGPNRDKCRLILKWN